MLKAAGWTVDQPFRIIKHATAGVTFLVHDVKVPEPEAAQLQAAFESVGIEIGGGTQPQIPVGELDLWVGPKNTVTSSR